MFSLSRIALLNRAAVHDWRWLVGHGIILMPQVNHTHVAERRLNGRLSLFGYKNALLIRARSAGRNNRLVRCIAAPAPQSHLQQRKCVLRLRRIAAIDAQSNAALRLPEPAHLFAHPSWRLVGRSSERVLSCNHLITQNSLACGCVGLIWSSSSFLDTERELGKRR